MIAAAALRMGRFTRFVPHSVMIGFLTGVAVNIVLGQLPDLVGSDVSGTSPWPRPGTCCSTWAASTPPR